MTAKNDPACPNLALATAATAPATTPASSGPRGASDPTETSAPAPTAAQEEVCRVRTQTLNDALRRTGNGGKVLITDGVLAESLSFAQAAVEAVARFDSFTPDNDPWGEHDCAVLEVEGRKVIWKIDYYDRRLEGLSPDPSDSKVTCRVLTIMLAEEY